jgi:hypothetical protein
MIRAMLHDIPVIEDEAAGDGIFLLPQVRPVVYLDAGQRESTLEQAWAATIEAYTQAARRGEVGVIRNVRLSEDKA